jgi:hypothetical protein
VVRESTVQVQSMDTVMFVYYNVFMFSIWVWSVGIKNKNILMDSLYFVGFFYSIAQSVTCYVHWRKFKRVIFYE